MSLSQEHAVELLRGLVAIPSLSRQEAVASKWLVEVMAELGYARAFVDEAGNAVGELGAIDARQTVILLGHIDTVPGNIPVRIETTSQGAVLYGRGSVDAKGPLATFVTAAALLGEEWARQHDFRIVVVGAVEEEYATSKGARFIGSRFNGENEPRPLACVIGEPSSWQRVTLGYKGRLLVELAASQPMAHTAGPDASVATVAVELWNWISNYATHFNQGRDKAFDQLTPSLRTINTTTDEQMIDRVTATVGIRLPLGFAVEPFTTELVTWAARHISCHSSIPTLQPSVPNPQSPISSLHASLSSPHSPISPFFHLPGPLTTLDLRFHAYEEPWRSERNHFLVRSFLAAIRQIAPEVRPGFVLKTGTSDMNVVGPLWGCPILAYGPGDSALDHTPNEHVHLEEYWRAVCVLEQALRNLPELINNE
jgi:LysW-gamma-L-lysine carboxypeptidase